MAQCRGITRKGNRCLRKVNYGRQWCYKHIPKALLKREFKGESKPDECIICLESLEKTNDPLECGHWIHTSCLIKWGKSECPVCRRKLLTLSAKTMRQIERMEQKRKNEQEEEERMILLSREMNAGGDILVFVDSPEGELPFDDDMEMETIINRLSSIFTARFFRNLRSIYSGNDDSLSLQVDLDTLESRLRESNVTSTTETEGHLFGIEEGE